MKKSYIFFMIAATGLCACNSVQPDAFVPVPETTPSINLVLSGKSGAKTRTAFGDTDGTTMYFNWVRADRIGLFLSSAGTDVSGAQNLKAMIDKSKGPGQNNGAFRVNVEGLSPNTAYDITLYYPYFRAAGTSGAEIHNRVAPYQVQEYPGSSSHMGRSGAFATAISHFTTPSDVDGATAEVEFELNHKTSYVWVKVSAADGDYSGMHLKRIRMSAPEGTQLAGETTYNTTSGTFSLTPGSEAASNYIELSVAQSQALSSAVQEFCLVAFPTPVAGKDITISYTLQSSDASSTKVLSHVITAGASSTMFAPGKVYVLQEQIPATAGAGWTEAPYALDTAELDTFLQGVVKACKMPTLQLKYTDNLFSYSTVIVNTDLYEANGWTSYLEETLPVTTTSLYQACSISKVPFAYIVCKMADDGVIDLDTPLLNYYPGLIDRFADDETTRARAAKVTPRMCITHCSGLKNDGNSSSNVTFSFDPGTSYQYSGVGISMTQWTLDHIKGGLLADYSKDYIFNQLGMTLTNYQWQSSFATIAPHGFNNGSRVKNTNLGNSNAAHSMRTSAEEYTKFLQWMLRGGDLSKEMYAEMFQAYTPVADNKFRALGWAMEENQEMGTIYYHTGSNTGFRSNSMIIPERNATLCYFYNSPSAYSPHADIFLKFFGNKYDTGAYGTPAIPEVAGTGDNGSAGNATVYDE